MNKACSSKWKNIRYFAATVRSPASVRNAFEGHRALGFWWTGILRLHGTPSTADLQASEWCARIADGFRFYGWLYRSLAVAMGGAVLLCSVDKPTNTFWLAALVASALYLWVVSKLAFSGAIEFEKSVGRRIWTLVAFLFFITTFLVGIVTALSVEVRSLGWLSDSFNLSMTAAVLMFGVGSYFVELAALVAIRPEERSK